MTKADGTPIGPLDHAGLTAHLDEATALFRAEGIPVESESLAGRDPASALVDLATQLPAAMIAMSTHARTGWNRTALGSVAMKVVHDSPCPVLVQRPVD